MSIINFNSKIDKRIGLLSDEEIKHEVEKCRMIEDFIDQQIDKDEKGNRVLSYGLSSYGYDMRLSDHFILFHNTHTCIDPKNFDDTCTQTFHSKVCIIPPNGFVLGCTLEKVNIPEDIMALCIGKSTYARCGIIVNVTPIEPGTVGHITLEFSNTAPAPVKLYAHEGICQFLFFRSRQCSISYKQRKGKYMFQRTVNLPR